MKRQRSLVRGSFALSLLTALLACGGDSSTAPKTPPLTQAEAQQVASALFTEVSKALGNVGMTAPTAASRTVAAMPTQTFSSPCTNGGTIGGSFTYSDNLNAQGTGTLNGSIIITPNACKVSTGTRMIEVGGSINFTFSLAFTQFAQSGDFTFHGGGAFTWAGGSCPMDYTVTIAPQGKVTIAGTLCGQTINGTA